MSEHTSGPWKVSHSFEPDWDGDWYIYGGPQQNCFIVMGDGWSEEHRANARLIATAPKLLEVAESALGLIDKLGEYDDEVSVGNALILLALKKQASDAIREAKE